eukprot:TRINITY_DN11957_c0_g1_i1.p1 TRINITY_DN11957_c0_g1~~TRINITY_DN11957_c0_g1_i1.p1  ORF type:complete len:720 (-),score=130.69 TRINITY_DN11957_c0_g1_i1:314-2356(-)
MTLLEEEHQWFAYEQHRLLVQYKHRQQAVLQELLSRPYLLGSDKVISATVVIDGVSVQTGGPETLSDSLPEGVPGSKAATLIHQLTAVQALDRIGEEHCSRTNTPQNGHSHAVQNGDPGHTDASETNSGEPPKKPFLKTTSLQRNLVRHATRHSSRKCSHCDSPRGPGASTDDFGTVAKFISKTDLHKTKSNLHKALESLVRIAADARGDSAHVFLDRYEAWSAWWASLKEPDRNGYTAKFISGSIFETLCVFVIICNSLWIWAGTDASAAKMTVHQGDFERYVEWGFVGFYVLELSLKLFVYRWFFFVNQHSGWNIFDLCLVSISVFEQAVLPALQSDDKASVDIKFLRILRLFKLAKLLRMVRVLQFVSNLRLFVSCLIGCGPSLFWAVIIIFMILLVFSMYLVQAMTMHVLAEGHNMREEHLETIREKFGSVFDGAVTLFQCVSGGTDWENAYSVIKATGSDNVAIFLFFVLFFVIAVWNIVTSIFIERTMEYAKPDIEGLMLIKRRKDIEDAKHLMKLVQMFTENGSRTISLTSFEEFMTKEHFRRYFDVRGIDVKDASMFFHMLCAAADVEDSTEVDVETFIGGCLRLKGIASSIDVQTLSFEGKVAHMLQKRFFQSTEDHLERIEERLGRLMCSSSAVPTPPVMHQVPNTMHVRGFSVEPRPDVMGDVDIDCTI